MPVQTYTVYGFKICLCLYREKTSKLVMCFGDVMLDMQNICVGRSIPNIQLALIACDNINQS